VVERVSARMGEGRGEEKADVGAASRGRLMLSDGVVARLVLVVLGGVGGEVVPVSGERDRHISSKQDPPNLPLHASVQLASPPEREPVRSLLQPTIKVELHSFLLLVHFNLSSLPPLGRKA
jgi:hypothetical protein